MYLVEIELPLLIGTAKRKAIEQIATAMLGEIKARVCIFFRKDFTVTVLDEDSRECEGLQRSIRTAIFANLYNEGIKYSEQTRRAKIDAQTQLLQVIEECAVTEDITETVFSVLTEKITGCMENLWKLCNKSWHEVCKELTKKGLEDFMERHLGEDWA